MKRRFKQNAYILNGKIFTNLFVSARALAEYLIKGVLGYHAQTFLLQMIFYLFRQLPSYIDIINTFNLFSGEE